MRQDHRLQAKELIDAVAKDVLLPNGYRRDAPTVFIRSMDDDQITHVFHFRYDKSTRREMVQIHLNTKVILNGHPHTQALKADKQLYESFHEGVLYSGYARLRYPRKSSMSSTVIVDDQTDHEEQVADVSRAVHQEVSRMSRFVGGKQALIDREMYKRRLFGRSIKPSLKLARYFAHTGQSDMFERIWQALQKHHPELYNDHTKANFYNKCFYKSPKK